MTAALNTHATAIRVRQMSKRFGEFVVVAPLDLDIARGELFGFLGPNGSGKTTTIRMLTGLLEPTSGSAEIVGYDVWKSPLHAKQHLAYVPDEPSLFPKLTGWEFLQFIGSVFRLPEDTWKLRAEELLTLFDMTPYAGDLIETYSHGMRQKLAISAALLHQPDVIFLDEPTVGLDPRSAKALKAALRLLCDNGATVFLTTHILDIAERLCDRVGIIDHGKLVALGSVAELRRDAARSNMSLEDIFLHLTGGANTDDVAPVLGRDRRGAKP